MTHYDSTPTPQTGSTASGGPQNLLPKESGGILDTLTDPKNVLPLALGATLLQRGGDGGPGIDKGEGNDEGGDVKYDRGPVSFPEDGFRHGFENEFEFFNGQYVPRFAAGGIVGNTMSPGSPMSVPQGRTGAPQAMSLRSPNAPY